MAEMKLAIHKFIIIVGGFERFACRLFDRFLMHRKIKLKMRVVITERKLLAVGLGNEQGQKRKLVRFIVLARIIINFLPKYQRNLLCAQLELEVCI